MRLACFCKGLGMSGLEHLRRAADRHGLGHLWKIFESRLPDLFIKDACENRVGVVQAKRDPVQWVSAEQLCSGIEGGSPTLLILSRHNSCSSIDITVEGFSTVCDIARITPFFLHFVTGMGAGFSSRDKDFMSCYSTFESESPQLPIEAKGLGELQADSLRAICYNIRHFERHGRDLEDPWSCRQSALHHSFLAGSGESTWVVIQPPEAFDTALDPAPHPMSLHLRYLRAGIVNWREYLDSFSWAFKLLNQRIAIPQAYHKFKVRFPDEQHLHYLRGKLHSALTILLNTKTTLGTIAEHEVSLAQEHSVPSVAHENFQRQLRNICREVDGYMETTHKLLRISDDIRTMYSDIITFRGQELQCDASQSLERLAQEGAAGNRDMAVLAKLAFKDSRSMQIATTIATFYLPINLVFSFFSTTLVWYGTAAEAAGNDNSGIRVRSEIWIASVSAVLLVIGTVCWSWWWNIRGERKLDKCAVEKISSI
ncbi:hypothetical protein F4802DRAFT_589612 [Xylaria palmicola]|nr:hypothetical protein F4802DRAFT_589612 [Xylaria palmicola]